MTSDPAPPMPDVAFESGFLEVVNRAELLAETVHSSVAGLLPRDLVPEQMPETAVWRLHLVATANYSAVVHCLKTRHTALGGYVLIRGLLEAWAHLDFIADDSESGNAATRAWRYEQGLLDDWGSTDLKLAVGAAGAKSADKQLREHWKRDGGIGKFRPRTYGQVTDTLAKIESRDCVKLLRARYSSCSAADHMHGVDFLLTGTGASFEVTWVPQNVRCVWLSLATSFFEFLTGTVFDLMAGEHLEDMKTELRRLCAEVVDDRFLLKVVEPGPLATEDVSRIADRLATALPPHDPSG